MKQNQHYARKCLIWLLIVQVISLSYTTLRNVINFGDWNPWLQHIISIGTLFCLFSLRKQHKCYLFAVVFLSIHFVCSLLHTILYSPAVFPLLRDYSGENITSVMRSMSRVKNILLPICSFISVASEFWAHRSLIRETNHRLNKCWIWLTGVTLVLTLAMRIASQVIMRMFAQETLNITLYQQIYPLLNIPGTLMKIAYMICLFYTVRALETTKEVTS